MKTQWKSKYNIITFHPVGKKKDFCLYEKMINRCDMVLKYYGIDKFIEKLLISHESPYCCFVFHLRYPANNYKRKYIVFRTINIENLRMCEIKYNSFGQNAIGFSGTNIGALKHITLDEIVHLEWR